MIRKKMVYYRPCIPLPSLAAGIRTYNGRLKAAVPRRGFHTHHSNVFHIFGILQGEISILMLKKELAKRFVLQLLPVLLSHISGRCSFTAVPFFGFYRLWFWEAIHGIPQYADIYKARCEP